ncbi:MAG: cyanophycin synthetase [Deltaproteobacteria bacterium]|nr:cyanophycin synthetase [Deltaproteobacteria bacterium]
MKIRAVRALRGPNIWANFTVLEVLVDLEELKDSPSNMIPGFNQRVMEGLPSLIEHRCGRGVRGGFFQRLEEGTYLGHVLEHVTLELQTLAGTDVGYGKARETDEEGVYKVAIEYENERLARECLAAAWDFCLAAVHNTKFDTAGSIARLKDLAGDVCLGPSTRAIVDAASARGIPVRRLNDASLVQLGFGAKQRRIMAAETDRTGAIAEEIAQDKELTKMILKSAGVPVPYGSIVHSREEAWTEAQDIGFPVTVKPADGNQGRGVAVNLSTQDQVTAAYDAASKESRDVLVEENVRGKDFRFLVVGNHLVAAACRKPAQVTGDGVHTVAELVAQENTNPRRGDHHALTLSKIPLDTVSLAVLSAQGLTPGSVPPEGACVLIRRNANLSTGGTAIDVTDSVHPLNASFAVGAAKCVGLDIAGVDIVAEDISIPLDEQGGKVIEVNAAPGLRMHIAPSEGQSQPVGKAIIDMLFPDNETGRIPLVAVTGVNGKTTTTRFIAHILKSAGFQTGMVCSDGVYVDGRRIEKGDCSGPQSAKSLLLNPFIDAAVLETARGGIIREGLGFDRCDVAVVTNIEGGDHLDQHDINTLEKLAVVKRTVVESVSKNGTAVLNAQDPLVAEMAGHCRGAVCFFSISGDNPVIREHCGKGGRALFVRDQMIILADGAQEVHFAMLDMIPLTHRGTIRFQVENVLASIGAAWALGLPFEKILTAAETFIANFINLPGRFNVVSRNGSTIIVDYGHNPSSLEAIIAALDNYDHKRRVAIYSTAGDRRDCDIILQGKLLGEAFDSVILYEDHYLRGRQKGDIIRLFRQGLAGSPRTKEVSEIFGSLNAIDAAMSTLASGSLLLIQADEVDETVDYMRKYFPFEIPLPAAAAHA